MSTYNGRDLARYLGSRQAAVAALLFWFGGASVFVSLIVGLQLFGKANFLGPEFWMLAIPSWGVVAVVLAFVLRRKTSGAIVLGLGSAWLAIALLAMVAFRIDASFLGVAG